MLQRTLQIISQEELKQLQRGRGLLTNAKKQFPKERYVASFNSPSGLIIETTYDPKSRPSISFAVSEHGRLSERAFVLLGDDKNGSVKLLPPLDPNGLIEKGVVLLPSRAEPYGSQVLLVDEICAFIHRYADVPSFWESLIAHYVLTTWLYDRFTAIPYLRYLGESQTGKTRLLQVTAYLATALFGIARR